MQSPSASPKRATSAQKLASTRSPCAQTTIRNDDSDHKEHKQPTYDFNAALHTGIDKGPPSEELELSLGCMA